MPPPDVDDRRWGACRFCGAASAPRSTACGICGAPAPLSAQEIPRAPIALQRRLRWTHALRTFLVGAAAVALAFALISAVLSGPPNVPDPLTTTATYAIGPGNYSALSGEITGGDYVVGNYTTIHPVGVGVAVSVFNSTEWAAFVRGGSATPVWSLAPTGAGRIVYSASYTDTFTFVFGNPYPAGSHLAITVYVATVYESNVGSDGFA